MISSFLVCIKSIFKLKVVFVLLSSTLILNGCSSIEPWVKPYERQNLADPITFFGRDPVSDNYMHHVRQARESARGAEGSAGGGCGCN
ncbi:MAG: hypothetical protein COA86_13170 [Kangiella sp.]|nr:MAG: hypothetical protein COA86_13170 [Kangiella sp.]